MVSGAGKGAMSAASVFALANGKSSFDTANAKNKKLKRAMYNHKRRVSGGAGSGGGGSQRDAANANTAEVVVQAAVRHPEVNVAR